MPRPCPYVGCVYHLFSDVSRCGSLKVISGTIEPWEMDCSCALDVATMGPHTYDEIAEMLGVSHERIRQIEARGLAMIARIFAVHSRWSRGGKLDE